MVVDSTPKRVIAQAM